MNLKNNFENPASLNENNSEKEQPLKIETIKGPDNGEVFYCPERGGIISSIKLGGKEILYLDEETFNDLKSNVKGGVPILFPNAGPLAEGSKFPNLEQHGFARKSAWQSASADGEFEENLSANQETMLAYPYDFNLSVFGKLEEDASFTITCAVENREDSKELPVSHGLHPYFKVPNTEKANIKFNFEGGELIEEQVETWANGKAVSIDNPKVKNPRATMEIKIPSLGTLVIDASVEYEKIWVWSMPGKDFVCVEPVMRNKNGLIDDPKMVKPKETFLATVNFKLKN